MILPSKEEFLRLAAGRRMPIYGELLADVETPLSAYWKLAHDETHSFLLESVTGGERLARYSFLGVRPRLVLRSKGRDVKRISANSTQSCHLEDGCDPLTLLKKELAGGLVGHVNGMPKFLGGAIGMLSYDYVRFLERLPNAPKDDLGDDDMAMMLTGTVVAFDHAQNRIRVIALADATPEAYDAACDEIARTLERLERPLPSLPEANGEMGEFRANQTPEAFCASVERAKQYIAQGDCIQVVLSQRFDAAITCHPLTAYRALRSLNPSPYMFLLRFGDFDLVGASPELLVSLEGRTCRVRPIAGTRWRGKSHEEDLALEKELLADQKERAEHIMLVDLGRNDLGRVSEYGSVKVNELMVVERYSHVMHIVSDVTGTLRSLPLAEGEGQGGGAGSATGATLRGPQGDARGCDAFDLLRASFPAGTVSGAPKVRAMQIIDELEPSRRGLYAGSVGHISSTGDMDMAITIRSIVMRGGVAHVQAGAGIVFDSIPEREHQECLDKARACMKALEMAHRGMQALK